ncbi:MAG: DEAD/DEAH box helicase family protein, partial [Anaerolineae bacterium]|nr:DEAD/DEAH box helicase family protein [Anaerolineae bacterium]
MQYAEVAVNLPVQMTFHYHIPAGLAGQLQPGHLVRVPFGTGEQPGIVVALTTDSPVSETKPVLELLDAEPVVRAPHIDTARWLAAQTLASLGACLWLFLPPGRTGRDVRVSPTEAGLAATNGPEEALERLDDTAGQLLSLLARRGPLLGRQLNLAMRGKNWNQAAEALVRRGLAHRASVLAPPSVQPRRVRTARLAIPAERIDALAPRLGRESRRANVLEVLLASPQSRPSLASVCMAAGCTQQVVKDMADAGDVILTPRRQWIELTAPSDEVAAQLDAGEFDGAPSQRDALAKLVRAGGALPTSELDSYPANALRQRGLARAGEQAPRVRLSGQFLTPGGDLDSAAVAARLIELRGGQKAYDVLRLLAREGEAVQVNWVYAQTGSDLALLRDLAEDGLIVLGEDESWRDPLGDRAFAPTIAPPFTPDQQAAWERLRAHLDALQWEGVSPAPDEPHVFLLHGVTGSGKTEVYMRAVEYTLAHGRGALVLVPEIALTPQTVGRFAARFPGQVTVVHGALSHGERFDAWRRARAGELKVIVGTRSALFTPLPDLGLIVLDEEHDGSYKQSPPLPAPYYHARAVSVELARRCRGIVMLGSATPSIESLHAARRGLYQRIVLPLRVAGHRQKILRSAANGEPALYTPGDPADTLTVALPPVDVVDMRAELKGGNTSMFSRVLQEALAGVLTRGEHALLFLNRRGTASYVFCRDCGYVATC